jgi:acyl dehydratase
MTGRVNVLYFDKVKFPRPVKVNSRIHAAAKLLDVNERAAGQILLKLDVTTEI